MAAVVLALALLLLLATQVWVEAVVEPAPAAPRSALGVNGGSAAPWATAAALLGLAAGVLASVRGSFPTRALVLLACLAALGATVRVVAQPAEVVGAGSGQVVSAGATGWAWAAVSTALLATTAAVASLAARPMRDRPSRATSARPPGPAELDRRSAADLDRRSAAEMDRRSAAEQWRALDDGRDPTGGA